MHKGVVVALLTEGVDRNSFGMWQYTSTAKSPSSRRAWIEMVSVVAARGDRYVALLTEGVDRNAMVGRGAGKDGVDRNSEKVKEFFGFQKSPSSRRAWIEI